MASSNWQVFQAHVAEGFTEDQAMSILGAMMQALVSTNIMLDYEHRDD